jgi:protein JSN1
LNGRDVLGSDVGAIRIGFAKVPTKGGPENSSGQEDLAVNVQGVGDLSVGATIHALRGIKGASTIPVDQQVLSGSLENYRSNLLLSMIGSGMHSVSYSIDGAAKSNTWSPSLTEQQMIMRELSGGSADAEPEIEALAGELFFGVYAAVGLKLCDRISSSYDVLYDNSISLRKTSQ